MGITKQCFLCLKYKPPKPTHMAAAAATASPDHHNKIIHLHTHTKKPTNAVNIIRRRRRLPDQKHHPHPSVVSPENSSWCCPSAVSSNKPPPSSDSPALRPPPQSFSQSPAPVEKSQILKPDSPAKVEKSNMTTAYTQQETFPSSFSNFNSALTAGLLNPMSPPPPTADKTRSSPTLFEMMANEPDLKIPTNSNGVVSYPNPKKPNSHAVPPSVVIDKQALMQQRLLDLLSCRSPGSQFNDPDSSDVKLTLSSKEGVTVSMNVHRQILVSQSRFFAVKLSDNYRGKVGQQGQPPYIVEISDCDDIEVYIESIRLMYCKDLRRRLMKEDVPRVLGILKVSAAIGFDAGVLSCLEYLEAAPWAEDEEEKVSSLLSELQLEGAGPIEVLKRVSVDITSGFDESDHNEVLLKLLHTVLEGKDEKARREMKVLVAKMLHENSSHNDLRKESLYSACDKCLILLKKQFLKASNGELQDAAQIARQADNLHFLLDILIDRQISEDFLKSWASLTELSEVHSKVPPLHRYEISRVTARLFVGIGKGQLLASKDLRCLLLQTWLVPFYDDFAWMKRASRGLDRHLIEEGLGNTILTLPLTWQQEILMTWFDRFLNSSDDCPNIQRAFEVWWKRAFWKKGHPQPERSRQLHTLHTTNENYKNS